MEGARETRVYDSSEMDGCRTREIRHAREDSSRMQRRFKETFWRGVVSGSSRIDVLDDWIPFWNLTISKEFSLIFQRIGLIYKILSQTWVNNKDWREISIILKEFNEINLEYSHAKYFKKFVNRESFSKTTSWFLLLEGYV